MKKMLCAAILSFAIFPFNVHAQTATKDWSVFNELSDKVLELGKEERFDEAREVLQYLSNQFEKGSRQTELTPEKAQIIDSTMELARETLARPNETSEEKLNKLTGFRLVIDAVNSDHQPLWKQTEYQLMNPLMDMKKAIQDKNMQRFQFAANQFLSHYEVIRPALMIDLSDVELQKLDQDIDFIDKNRDHFVGSKETKEELEVIQADFEALYHADRDTSEPSLFWLIFSIGGVIFVTLTYVGWRKYKAEKENVRVINKHKDV